jgi:hypothetical protein
LTDGGFHQIRRLCDWQARVGGDDVLRRFLVRTGLAK